MKVIVAGPRDFHDYSFAKKQLDRILQRLNKDRLEIVSGGANGADALGERYAKENGYKLHRKPADWKKHKKAAGPIRNREMAQYADALVAFQPENGSTPGTKNMIKTANELGLKVRIVYY